MLIQIAQETGIPMVVTNDSHYIEASDYEPHDILLCIQTQKTILDDDRMRYDGDQFYLKSPEEMYRIFPQLQEAYENTNKIAARCNVEIKFHEYKLPNFPCPDGHDSTSYLKELCDIGLVARYGDDASKHMERLDYELSVINKMGFSEYFLIVWDFIRFARENKIMVGPGRGSGAGCVVAYSLRITDVDPIPYNLLFERFLNPERISMPDFDIDFCYERRQEVIDYVIDKYGSDHVAQIITFGTMKAKAATRDVGRALAMPYADVDRVAKMIPAPPGANIKINDALKMNPELREAYDNEDDTHKLINMSMRLEGLPRHSSTHAAGVVICDRPVMDYVPLNTNDGVITTQFPMGTCEELGLLKMDFLGLRTLTVIRIAAEEVKRGKNIDIDLDHWTYDDPKVYEMVAQGKTAGVFQLESSGMTSFMRELAPESLEDLTAGISLYRPGPMDYIPQYIKGKKNSSKVRYMHPKLKPILEATYGVIVYQEQVMQIVQDLAGYSLGRADLIRRAMSKKKADVMAEEKKKFIHGSPEDNVPGCVANGVPEHVAMQIFDAMEAFAAYAFNKSHAAGYAVIGYQTAWLKYYYPVEFMAALMTSVIDAPDKVVQYINECKKMNIKLLPPDVNDGIATFSVSGDSIRFGLASIKNVGRGPVQALVAERDAGGKYKGVTDFIRRLEGGDINKRCLESLIRSGAFDSLGGKRSQYINLYPNIVDGLSHSKKATVTGQLSLFDVDETSEEDMNIDILPAMSEFPKRLMLMDEKQLLGIYVSGHPLAEFIYKLAPITTTTSLDFMNTSLDDPNSDDVLAEQESSIQDGASVKYGGMITSKSVKYTKADNKPFCFLTVEDMYGQVEVIVFSKMYEKFGARLQENEVIVVQGRASLREDEAGKITAMDILFYNEIPEPSDAAQTIAKKIFWIKVPKEKDVPAKRITDILQTHRGDTTVMIYKEAENMRYKVNDSFWVNPNDRLTQELELLLGSGTVKITSK